MSWVPYVDKHGTAKTIFTRGMGGAKLGRLGCTGTGRRANGTVPIPWFRGEGPHGTSWSLTFPYPHGLPLACLVQHSTEEKYRYPARLHTTLFSHTVRVD